MEELKDFLEESRENGNQAGEAGALYGIGQIYFKDKIHDAALDFWEQCETICRESKQDRELAQVLIDLGDLALVGKDTDLAGKRFGEALSIYTGLDLPNEKARVLERLGLWALKSELPEKALQYYSDGLAICLKFEDKVGGLYFLDQIVPILKNQNRTVELIGRIREIITLSDKIGDRERMALGLAGLADAYQKNGSTVEALPCLEMAHDIFLRMGREKEAGFILEELLRLGGKKPGEA